MESSRTGLVNQTYWSDGTRIGITYARKSVSEKQRQKQLWTRFKLLIHHREPSIPRCPSLILMMSEQDFSLCHPNCASSIKQMLVWSRSEAVWTLYSLTLSSAPGARPHLHWSIISQSSESVFSVKRMEGFLQTETCVRAGKLQVNAADGYLFLQSYTTVCVCVYVLACWLLYMCFRDAAFRVSQAFKLSKVERHREVRLTAIQRESV